MIDFSALKLLVLEWTRKAQSAGSTDDERHAYYGCAQELHRAIQRLEEYL